jgi:DNA modification methylase
MITVAWGSQGGSKKPHWHGPGNLTHLAHLCLRGEDKHKTEKPLDQALDLVSWFSDPGDWVFDPFAGRGTFGLACKILGRNYIGVEMNPAEAQLAQARIEAWPNKWVYSRDVERHDRFQRGNAWLGKAVEA